jgi:hypothetical protein
MNSRAGPTACAGIVVLTRRSTRPRAALWVGPRFAIAWSVIVSGMGLSPHVPSGGSSSGRGPFGEKAFKGALIGCVVLVVIGLLMVLLGGDAPRSVGTSFLVLGVLGLVTAGAGLLAERLLQRHPPPPPDVRRGNGRGPHRPDPSRLKRHLRERP